MSDSALRGTAHGAFGGGGGAQLDGFAVFTSRVPYTAKSIIVDGGPLDEDGAEDGVCAFSVQVGFDNSKGGGVSAGLLPGSYRFSVNGAETVLSPDPNSLEQIDTTVQARLPLQLAIGEKLRLKQQVTGFRKPGKAQRTTDRDSVLVRCLAADLQRDPDRDGILNAKDNCPNTFNPEQRRRKRKAMGDACDAMGMVGGDGGTVTKSGEGDAGDVTITVPSGSLGRDTAVSVGVAEAVPIDQSIVGSPIEFSAEGAQLAQAVRVQLSYSDQQLEESGVVDQDSLRLVTLQEGTGRWIRGHVNRCVNEIRRPASC
jgi:hypothetical protein